MKKHKAVLVGSVIFTISLLMTTAFALEESEVQSAIAASSQDQVSGNVFIWFLCAVAFLKISQKIDSFMSGLGINVGRTGGSMIGELMLAGRALGGAVRATGGAIGGIFNHGHTSANSTVNHAAGQVFTGNGGSGLVGAVHRSAGNAAAANVTGTGSSIGSFIGGAMFGASTKSGGRFATDVVSAVAHGNISQVGSITGNKASEALTSYLGYNTEEASAQSVTGSQSVPGAPEAPEVPESPEDIITMDGGTAAGGVTSCIPDPETEKAASIPSQPPVFHDVEIGGGRITGYEAPSGGGEEKQFAMYSAEQYMQPTGQFEMVQTADGASWYKQYAQPTVCKTPFKTPEGKIKYNETIVDELPQIPKRKDRI